MTQQSDPTSSPDASSSPPPTKRKQRHPVRLIVRILLLVMAVVMVVIVVVERPKRSAAIESFDAIQAAGDLTEEELNALILGDPQVTSEDGAIVYTWPGVVQDYHLRATLSSGRVDRVDRYTSGPLATVAEKLGLN